MILKKSTIGCLVSSCCLFGVSPADAHTKQDNEKKPGLYIDAALAASWRSEGAMVKRDGIWQIPGVLMGGEAFPVEKSYSLDDAFIDLNYRHPSGVYAQIQLASHDNSLEVELHHALAGIEWGRASIKGFAEGGRMAATFTPANPEHASQRPFSETPLALDAFFGGQLNDEGARAGMHFAGFTLAVESWRGRAFPATPGEDGGALDAYLHYHITSNRLRGHVGLWGYQAQALNRTDDRYNAGHSHGNSSNVSAPELWFDGDTDAAGVFARIQWPVQESIVLSAEAQWMQVKPQGNVRDTMSVSEMKGHYEGGWSQALVQVQRHGLGIRYERLTLENQLSGAAAADLARASGLLNEGFEPNRTTLLYQFTQNDMLSWRLEWVDDQSMPEQTDRIVLGVVWGLGSTRISM